MTNPKIGLNPGDPSEARPDPLSPSSLAQVPDADALWVDYDLAAYRFNEADDNRNLPDRPKVMDRLEARMVEAKHKLLAAVRDAVLSAERNRLFALTTEAVVEAAARAIRSVDCGSKSFYELPWVTQELYRGMARAALPLLLAPEVARREAVEWERDRLARVVQIAEDEATRYADRVNAAEAERDRLREALEHIRRKLLPLHRALTPTESAIEQACDAALAGDV